MSGILLLPLLLLLLLLLPFYIINKLDVFLVLLDVYLMLLDDCIHIYIYYCTVLVILLL